MRDSLSFHLNLYKESEDEDGGSVQLEHKDITDVTEIKEINELKIDVNTSKLKPISPIKDNETKEETDDIAFYLDTDRTIRLQSTQEVNNNEERIDRIDSKRSDDDHFMFDKYLDEAQADRRSIDLMRRSNSIRQTFGEGQREQSFSLFSKQLENEMDAMESSDLLLCDDFEEYGDLFDRANQILLGKEDAEEEKKECITGEIQKPTLYE